jgi:DNA polymerase
MDDFVSIDFETRAVRNLKIVGVHKYVECPYFKVLCMSYAFGQEDFKIWKAGQPCPPRLAQHVRKGGMIHAWGAQFERVVWWKGLPDWPKPKRTQFRCSQVRGLATGLPAKLEEAAPAMRVNVRKDKIGAQAMRKLSKPRKMVDGKPIWWDDPGLYDTLYEYCIQDGVVERAIANKLPLLSPSEEKQYWFDQKVSDRGIKLDQKLCHAGIDIMTERQPELARQCQKITGLKPTQTVALRQWILKQDFEIANLKKDTIERALANDNVPDKIRSVLMLRAEAGKSSTSKFARALQCVCNDGTLKGMRQFYGAHTGRWAGRLVQLDNLMRPTMDNVEDVVKVVRTGRSGLVESVYGNVMEPVANSVRSMLTAETGTKLYVGDYKSIESRILALTSGQQSTLDQWRLSDEGKGPDVYVKNAANMFNVSIDKVTKELRFWGKTAELSLGYEGGERTLLAQAVKNNAAFRDIFAAMFKNADEDTRRRVDWIWNIKGEGNEKDWRAARFVVERWRKDNRMTVKLWDMLKRAAVKAVENPGTRVPVRGITFVYDRKLQILHCWLMSGLRSLRYPFAHVVTAGDRGGNPERQLRAYYQSNAIHQWVEYHPYGGLLTENIVQAQARDIMAYNFQFLEEDGFSVRHTVHDEIITQAVASAKVIDFKRAMTHKPKWALPMPLNADCWMGDHYRKAA